MCVLMVLVWSGLTSYIPHLSPVLFDFLLLSLHGHELMLTLEMCDMSGFYLLRTLPLLDLFAHAE